MENQALDQEKFRAVVALCKRKGFIFPGSDLYGGFANTYSYGPYGTELKKNIKDLWWKRFIHGREDMTGMDGPILLHPKAWEASGHVEGFNDALIDCKECKSRFRVDHLIESAVDISVEGLSLSELNQLMQAHNVECPKCHARKWTDARNFNLMFTTKISKTSQDENEGIAYLRPETAQAIFLDFKNINDTVRIQIPFGVGQIGKAFRNEITPGNFIFRVIEFEQMEIEYFIPPTGWEDFFEMWLKEMQAWCEVIGLPSSHLSILEHPQEKLSHYSKRTVDIMYQFPFGKQELYGLAYRTDFDLTRHSQYAKTKIEYTDPKTNEKWTPHVIEPTFGLDRTILALLCHAYEEEKLPDGQVRTVLHFPAHLAPVKVAIFPLMKKEELVEKARSLYAQLKEKWNIQYDDSGAIGKRYRRQDEIGTPYCVTIDFDTLENQTVTVRNRDTMQQERIAIDALIPYLEDKLSY